MYYKLFDVDGVANETEMDAGLVSTVESPVTLKAVIISVSAYFGNVVEGWIGNERIMTLPDYNFDTYDLGAAATPPISQHKILRLPVDQKIKAGSIFKIGVRCGDDATDLDGAYEYEPTT